MDDDEDMADLYLTVSTLLQRVFKGESACTQTYSRSTLWIHAAARMLHPYNVLTGQCLHAAPSWG